MKELSASGLADLAGVTDAEIARLVELGILVPRDGAGLFLDTDVQKVRLAGACEQAGLPMERIAAAIRAGRLSFACLEAAPFRRWAVRSTRTNRQVSQETGVPLLQLALSSGTFDLAWLSRLGRAHADGLRLLAMAWTEAYQARFEGPALASGADQRTAMELAAQLGGQFLPVGDPALLGIYRRQQELARTELWSSASRASSRRPACWDGQSGSPAMAFLDLVATPT
jgi:hypothetical protein